MGSIPSLIYKGVGVRRVYLGADGRTGGRTGGSKNAPKMLSDFAETLVRCSLGPIWIPGLGTRLVRNSYISFQRPSTTRAFGNVTLEYELDQTDGGSVLVGSNDRFWWVMFATFSEIRFFSKCRRPRAPDIEVSGTNDNPFHVAQPTVWIHSREIWS